MSFIPQRFRKAIQLHLLNNYSASVNMSTPLILGIDGYPGDGKTFQCNEVLGELECNIVSLSASDFGSIYESNAANYIIENYREAATKPMPVLVLNDLDTAIGNWGSLTQYTANRQFVLNEIMHLCDFPENPHDIPTKRVPIIMTGNDFKKIYAPLIRFGRMNHFEWIPTYEERFEIVSDMLFPLPALICKKVFDESEKYYINKQNISNKLIKKRDVNTQRHSRTFLPISFYSQLRMEIINQYLSKNLDQFGWYQVHSRLSTMKNDLYDEIIEEISFNSNNVLDIAKQLIDKFFLKSFV